MELEPFVFRHEGRLIGMRRREEGDGLLESVNGYALRPLTRDEFVVFTLDLCHNQVDRHFSRFPDEELQAINGMVPGRPLMERHDLRGSLPRGTFFRSQLHQSGERVSVRPDVYVLHTKENDDFILNIEGGVYRETSIGFSFQTPECSVCGRDLRTCDHVPGRSYGDAACHYVMRHVLEVIEGSVVPSGSQGTGFVAQARALSLGPALDSARQAYHQPIELQTPPSPVLPAAVVRAIGAAAAEDGFDVQDAPRLIADGCTARQRAIARFLGLGRELDGDTFDEPVWRKSLDGLSLDEIHAQLRVLEVRFDRAHPPQAVSQPEALPAWNDAGRSDAVMAILRDD